MNNFTLNQPADVGDAIRAAARPDTAFIAGGTTVIDLWKLGAYHFSELVDLSQLNLREFDDLLRHSPIADRQRFAREHNGNEQDFLNRHCG